MTREIKVKVTLETEEQLTEDEVNAIKKSLSGQMIKILNADGLESRIVGIFEHVVHVEPVHTPQTMT
jgi:hypothetical protein